VFSNVRKESKEVSTGTDKSWISVLFNIKVLPIDTSNNLAFDELSRPEIVKSLISQLLRINVDSTRTNALEYREESWIMLSDIVIAAWYPWMMDIPLKLILLSTSCGQSQPD
jgi:hypothetical protein